MLASTAFQIANNEIRQVCNVLVTPFFVTLCARICSCALENLQFKTQNPFIIAQVTGLSAGHSAMDHVFRNFSDYVEKKEKIALQSELQARTEEAMVL
jgi:hypothetical protein